MLATIVRQESGNSALGTLAGFFDPFAAQNLSAVRRFNYLDNYIQNGGKFWLCGQQPTEALWDFGRSPPEQPPLKPYPLNVTNWRGHNDEPPMEIRRLRPR